MPAFARSLCPRNPAAELLGLLSIAERAADDLPDGDDREALADAIRDAQRRAAWLAHRMDMDDITAREAQPVLPRLAI